MEEGRRATEAENVFFITFSNKGEERTPKALREYKGAEKRAYT